MALPSRLGAFMVGATLGAAQCFYWLHDDVAHLHAAMTRKIDYVKSQVDEKERLADLQLAALEAAVPRDVAKAHNHTPL